MRPEGLACSFLTPVASLLFTPKHHDFSLIFPHLEQLQNIASDHSPHLLHVHPLFGLILSLAAASSAEMSADDLVRLSRRALLLLVEFERVGRSSFGFCFGGAKRAVMDAGRLLSHAAQVVLVIGLTSVQRLQDQFDGRAGGGVVLEMSAGSELVRFISGKMSATVFGFLRGGCGDVGWCWRSSEDFVCLDFVSASASLLDRGFDRVVGVNADFAGVTFAGALTAAAFDFPSAFFDLRGFIGGSPG